MRKSFTFFTLRITTLLILIYCLSCNKVTAQPITEIITTYHNYWKSGSAAINPVRPDTSHELLAFTYGGIRFSTGVNDDLLTTHGDAFTAADFIGLPMQSLTGAITNNTKLALGALYDGVANGPSLPAPVNNIPLYLSDGSKGMNLGTGIANLPIGILSFAVSTVNPAGIGDGVPDVVVTQIADPATTSDDYEFYNAAGVTVGHLVSVTFNGVAAVGNWTADFYEANTSPASLQTGFTQTSRPLRLWAGDLADFGVTPLNAATITGFRIHLKGPSDIAFVGFNNATFQVLPVTLAYFNSELVGKDAKLIWQTQTENNSKYFVLETSTDARNFTSLDTLSAAGNSSTAKNYSYLDRKPALGIHYYRLKEIDIDGKFMYSALTQVSIAAYGSGLSVSPNPAVSRIKLVHPVARAGDKIELYSVAGLRVLSQAVSTGASQTELKLPVNLIPGMYVVTYIKINGDKQTIELIVK